MPDRQSLIRQAGLLMGIAAGALTAASARAENCRNGSFAAQTGPFGLAKVIGAPRTYLLSDAAPCPNGNSPCRTRAYVVPGNTVLTGAASGNYVCAFYPAPHGGSAGYVEKSRIAAQPVPSHPPVNAWIGEWKDGDNNITLRAQGGALTASGNAYWPAANPPLAQFPGGPNVGDMGGTATPNGSSAIFASGTDPADCRVTATLVPPYLIVADNMNCGGMNVSFTGVYRKR